jgi:REP-associated tyrosine transposase
VVAVDVPHHITQRGNNRQDVFPADADRQIYLEMLRSETRRTGIRLLGWCLMSNHVHLVAVPERSDSFAKGLGRAHFRYALDLNQRHGWSGHLWQNRFYSCPLDRRHLGLALRYVDLNPVRAGLVERAEQWRWSSARAHIDGADPFGLLDVETWREWCPLGDWEQVLRGASETAEQIEALRQATRSGRPCAEETVVADWERRLGRKLHAARTGRPPKAAAAAGS